MVSIINNLHNEYKKKTENLVVQNSGSAKLTIF
jgi:hypothetical protein